MLAVWWSGLKLQIKRANQFLPAMCTDLRQAIKIWRRERPGSIAIDAMFWQNLNQLSTVSFFVCVTTPATGIIKAACAKQLDSFLTVHVPEYEHTKVRSCSQSMWCYKCRLLLSLSFYMQTMKRQKAEYPCKTKVWF